ncbi:hypothetical protein NF27_JK00060 [Candidatus Jidaibacter acanthamoeba]|uniref:Uncharacterized protein n=1 Tax=Candidatus Jidaibacter acanthamoebae TaxID=86105 RepID=A0A0C1MW59_9RICK|nr:hypothetical protein NF27_JK00060 [Candidatus Jidaibacter acanthamoeba]
MGFEELKNRIISNIAQLPESKSYIEKLQSNKFINIPKSA